jgi:hypothetical protein
MISILIKEYYKICIQKGNPVSQKNEYKHYQTYLKVKWPHSLQEEGGKKAPLAYYQSPWQEEGEKDVPLAYHQSPHLLKSFHFLHKGVLINLCSRFKEYKEHA